MNLKKIVLAIDFSEMSKAALHQASALARDTGATLDIVHVLEYPFVDSGFGVAPNTKLDTKPDRKTDHQWVEEQLQQVVPTDPTVSVTHHLLEGNPADALVRYAKNKGVDLIILGTHGRRGISRLLLGSVAEAVVRRSPCPVLTVKDRRYPLGSASGDTLQQQNASAH